MPALTANAYLGGFGIKAALDAGAQVVVTGRVTDAALVVGPAAHRFGWEPGDLDALAGAVVAGHVIECGTQATGGNYAFFERVPGLEHPGFPIAEVEADGSSTITKHARHRWSRSPSAPSPPSCSTRSAGPAYANPDVTARFDTIELSDAGTDRVRISGVRGDPPPDTLKVAVNYLGGFSNTMTLVLTGLAVEEKAALAERTLWARVPRQTYEHVDVQLVRGDRPDPGTAAEAQAHLRITVKDRDPVKVGRAFSNLLVEIGLGTYPGYFPTTVPGDATPYGVYWPTTVAADHVTQHVVVDGEPLSPIPQASHVIWQSRPTASEVIAVPGRPALPDHEGEGVAGELEPTVLGALVGARSGDKGGNANVGVWVPEFFEPARRDSVYDWLLELAHGRPRPRPPPGDRRARGRRPPAARPARGQRGAARVPRPRGRGQRPARPAGQGARRTAARAPGRCPPQPARRRSGRIAVTTMTPSTARGRRTRDGLVSAARAVFERRGFSDTRMSDIADAASVSHGTVYTYFPSKEAVLSEVCNAIVGEVFAAVRVPDDQRADPITWIEEGNRRYLRAYSNNARMLEVVEQAAAADPQFRELVDGLRAVFVDKSRATLIRFQAEGLADPTLDPEIAGPALVGMVESFARRWHAHGETYDAEAVVATLTRLWTQAVGLQHQPTTGAGP